MTSRWTAASAALLVSIAAPAATVLDGVYSDAQAGRGAALYQARCAGCHDGADVDGPPLTGDPFIDRWREDSLASLFDFIRTNMPQDAPGKLDDAAYRDLLAYLLQANKYSSGKELTPESLPAIDLVGHSGPQPLPTNAVIRATGCLSQGANNAWMLANAAEPKRTRAADHSTPEELASSAAASLGSQSFKLQNLEDLPAFHGDALKGHKVLVKGVLIRQTGNDRINVGLIENLASACGGK